MLLEYNKRKKYNIEKEPIEFIIGELEDDWNELLKIGKKESEPVNYVFVWVSSILRNIGENVV